MKNRIYSLLIFCGLIIVAISCGTPKRAIRGFNVALTFDTLVGRVNSTHQQVLSFSGRYHIEISTGREETSVVAQVRYFRDSALWASVYIIPGLELFRVLLTPDSVKIIDRVHETYLMGTNDQWSSPLPVNFNYQMIVGLLIPYIRMSPGDKCSNCLGNQLIPPFSNEGYKIEITGPKTPKTIYSFNDKGQITSLHRKTNQDQVDVRYRSFKKYQNFEIPGRISIAIRGRNKLKIAISYEKFDVNVPVEIPFKIPKTYKRLLTYEGF